MQHIQFQASHSRLPEEEIVILWHELASELRRLQAVLGDGYADPRGSVNLPQDKAMLTEVKRLIPKYRGVELLIVIGLGGSNLGTLAIDQALRLRNINPIVVYLDTVDGKKMERVREDLIQCLDRNQKVVVNIISKSGTTTETIANSAIILDDLKLHQVDLKDTVVVTAGFNSQLWNWAGEFGIDRLSIPESVGGRFSVFSPVGLFPLELMGIDTEQILEGATWAVNQALISDQQKNQAAQSAIHIFGHNRQGINILENFFFAPELEGIGKWYRQLVAENLGKEFDRGGNLIYAGITPTVAIGSTDLHSMSQLYLGGPHDKLINLIKVEQQASWQVVNKELIEQTIPALKNKTFAQIYEALYTGIHEALVEAERPFMEISLPEVSPYILGEFMQFKMIETMFLGHLLNINAFDQPAVEKYKKIMREILAR